LLARASSRCDSADGYALPKLRCPPIVEEEAPILNTYTSRRENTLIIDLGET
jgi:hypothetical protein